MSKVIGYEVQEDCTLGYHNFEYEERIMIDEHCEDHDWPGIVWYETYPQIFKPIYSPDKNTQP